ncbi:MAG: DciA family protein [Pseudomonadota bacterium]
MSRPRSLASLVRPVARKAIGKQAAAIGQLMADWPALFPDGPARAAWPEALSFPKGKGNNGTLTLRVDPADALILQHDGDRIIARVNQHLGQTAIARLKLVQRATGTVKTAASPRVSNPDTSDLDAMLDEVDSSELRDHLRRIGLALWTRDPGS